MKKVLTLVFTMFVLVISGLGQTKKALKPEFQITSLKIVCCGGGPSTLRKAIVHVIYNNAPSGTKVKIEDMSGGLIGSYVLSGDDFKTPCLNLIAGASYKITYIDNAGLAFPFTPSILVAPSCGIRKYEDAKALPKKL